MKRGLEEFTPSKGESYHLGNSATVSPSLKLSLYIPGKPPLGAVMNARITVDPKAAWQKFGLCAAEDPAITTPCSFLNSPLGTHSIFIGYTSRPCLPGRLSHAFPLCSVPSPVCIQHTYPTFQQGVLQVHISSYFSEFSLIQFFLTGGKVTCAKEHVYHSC